MEEDRGSQTAEGTAIQRALHQTVDEDPKILNDPVAERLVDPSSDFYKSFVAGLERMPAHLRLQRRGYVVMRDRYTEDCLTESLAREIKQYVILGAGLDTFATDNLNRRNLLGSSKSIIRLASAGSGQSLRPRIFTFQTMLLFFRLISRS
jgi:O-methyltransferase involved in polyketide biosynthesis